MIIHSNKFETPSGQRAALAPKQAAQYVGVCSRTLANLVKAGRLSDVKVGRRRLYRVDELNALLGQAVQ